MKNEMEKDKNHTASSQLIFDTKFPNEEIFSTNVTEMLMDAENKPWINSKMDKFIGLNRFGEINKRKKLHEQEAKQLKQYAEQNPNSWQIRFVKRRKNSKDMKENRPKCHKSHTLIKKTSSSAQKLKSIKDVKMIRI